MQVAVLGLSKMGKLVAEKLLNGGHEVVAWSSSREELDNLRTEKAEFVVNQKLIIVHTIDELRNYLRKPRVILSVLASGEPTQTALSQVNNLVEIGDIIIDGGDSHYKDTNRYFEGFGGRGIKFLGVGMAGGAHALESGLSLMIGGDPEAYEFLVPIFDTLSDSEGSHALFGTGGAGHFVRMVHSAIEVGMTQSIAEGMGLLKSSEYELDLEGSIYTWQEGGVISSFLLDMALGALEKDPNLSQFEGQIASPPSAKWAVEEAKSKAVPTPTIAQSIDFRERSSYDRQIQETFVAKMAQAIKNEVEGPEEKPVGNS